MSHARKAKSCANHISTRNEHIQHDYLFYFDFAATVLVKLIHELRQLSLVHIYPHLQQRARPESEHMQQKQDQFTNSTRKS
jgi:hypothetical protein